VSVPLLILCVLPLAASGQFTWWTGFHDPDLERVVQSAMEKSFAVRLAQARLSEKGAGVKSAKAERLPSIEFRGQNAQVQGSIPSVGGGAPGAFIGPNERGVVQNSVEAKLDLDVWQRKKLANEAAWAEYSAAQKRARAEAIVSAQHAGKWYIDLRAVQQRLQIGNRELATLQELLDVTQARRRAGLVNQGAEAATQAEVARVEARLRALEEDADTLVVHIAEETGQSSAAWKSLRSSRASVPLHEAMVSSQLPAELLLERPDVEASRQLLAAAMALRKEAKRARLPQLQIIGSIGRLAESFPGLLLGGSNTFTIGNSLQMPLFDGGRLRANFETRSAQERQAAIRLEETIAKGTNELATAQAKLLAAIERRQSLERARTASAEEAEIAERLFRSGLGEWSEVLERKRRVFAQEEELVINRAAQSRAQIEIYAALGGSW
jgi:NodT family efflux transporter outer membrane factor (OMF) lipoprotein